MSAIGKASRTVLKKIGFVATIETSDEDAELLERIRKHIELDDEATSVQRALELDDLRFCDPATQWTDEDRKVREDAGRPCLTEDRLGPFLMQICNEQRKNKPGGQINPVDSDADVDTAEIIQGLIRHIEYSSNADTAYDTAFEWAVRCGRGFYRLCTAYVDAETNQQEIQIKRVANPHMVFIDPAAQEADYSDMKWGGFKQWYSKEDYAELYSDSQLANATQTAWLSIGDDAPSWMSKDGGACLVTEYFYKESKKVTVGKGSNKRETTQINVKRVVCTAVEVLERSDLPGELIPIIAVLGKELIQDGVRTYSGIVRSGKDPQKRHNYLLTSQVERIAFMPLATWVGAKGFMGKNAKIWQNAHKNQMAALEYEIIGDEDKQINAPRLITEEAPIVAVTQAMEGAEQGFKAVLGMYDANMGNRQAGESGIALQRLQQQGDTGNYHFQDNLSRAIRYEIRIILSWLSTYYDTEQVIRILGEDLTPKQIRINGKVTKDDTDDQTKVGKIFDVRTGRYDVTISAGPSYQSKRQEDRAMLLSMLQGPMGELIAQRAGDLVAKTLDSPIAKELSERLVPADIAAKEQQETPVPPALQQHLQQMDQQNQQLTQALHTAIDQLESAKEKADQEMAQKVLDAETRIRVAEIAANAQLAIAAMKGDPVKGEQEGDAQIAASSGDASRLEQLEELVLSMHEALTAPQSQPDQSQTPAGAPEPAQPTPAISAGAQPPTAGGSAGMEQL
jgi:hypothetical protein